MSRSSCCGCGRVLEYDEDADVYEECDCGWEDYDHQAERDGYEDWADSVASDRRLEDRVGN